MKIKTPQGDLSVIAQGKEGSLPLLFLHADCGRATQWQAVLDRLGASRKVYALDFHGHGDSAPATNGDYSYAARVADIDETIGALGLTRFGLVAHSGSVGAALDYGAAHRRAVSAIFLLDPATDPRAVPVEMRDGYVAAMRGPDNLATLQGYCASIAGGDERVRKQVLEDCATADPKARTGAIEGLSGWTGPLFILAGPVTDTPTAFFATRPIPHRIMPNVGHWLQMEQSEAVALEIEHFFAEKQ